MGKIIVGIFFIQGRIYFILMSAWRINFNVKGISKGDKLWFPELQSVL